MPIWEDLQTSFREINEVINEYRPHQARETLILMMEQQIERVKGETKAVRESVGRARQVVEGLAKEELMGGLDSEKLEGMQKEEGRRRRNQDVDKRIWEVLETEVGRI